MIDVKLSEGVPRGRFVELYNPENFQEHEEVIVFTRDEFNRTYTYMQEQIDYINKQQTLVEIGEEWKLLGYWPKIMGKVHLLDKNMDSIFKKEPLQSYLDAYLHDTIVSSQKNVTASEKVVSVKL